MSKVFDVSGFPELKRDFERLDYSKQEKVLNKFAREMAEPIRRRAGELAPVLTGTLSRNIIISGAGQLNDRFSVSVLIGPSMKAFYGLFPEIGVPRKQPFLDPAFEQEADRAIETGAQLFSKHIEKAMVGGKR